MIFPSFLLALQLFCVGLMWDPSPSPEVTGYKLYYGVQSRVYTNSVTLSNVITGEICGLVGGTEYFITATAFDAQGYESDYCNEVRYIPPWKKLPNPTDLLISRSNAPPTTGSP